jgi:acetyl esterase/lipase
MTEQERQFLRDFETFLANPPAGIEAVRAQIDAFTDRFEAISPGAPRIGDFHADVRLRDGLCADVVVPPGTGPHPVLLYLHGGGWVAGSPKSHRRLAQHFAEAGYLTVNLDYRLAPEHPFPAGYDDCEFAARWVRENAARWNGQADRLAIGGDSAGANLAAAVAAMSGQPFRAAVLIYGIFDFAGAVERGAMGIEGVARAYLATGFPASLPDPRVSPIRGVTAKFPPAFVTVGTADALLPESLAIAENLKAAAVPHELRVVKDMIHGFIQFDMLEECRQTLAAIFAFLKERL